MTSDQKAIIRKGLRKVSTDRAGFVRWMIRIFNTK